MIWIGIIIGVFVGTIIGIFVTAMCIAAKRGDELNGMHAADRLSGLSVRAREG